MKIRTLGYSPWGTGRVQPFDAIFDKGVNCFTSGFKGIDAFVLWGGTDIHPSLYKEEPSRYSGAPHEPSERDIFEWKALQYCKANDIPVIGVCRGAQMMCAFAGGKLIQHVAGHANGGHHVDTIDGQSFYVTSAHHQMLDLRGTDHELIGWSNVKRSHIYATATEERDPYFYSPDFKEPEFVYFPTMRGIAIQGHPEWAEPTSPFVQYSLDLVREYCLNEVSV